MRTVVRLLAVLTIVIATVMAGAGTASAEPTGALASYRGGTIDLSEGWGDAIACVVFSRIDVRCFDTYEEADAAAAVAGKSETTPSGRPSTLAKSDCGGGWLCLWEDAYYSNRRLQFSDGYWQDLSAYGFNDKTSSWFNNQDCAWYNSKNDWGYLWDWAYGSSISLSPCGSASTMGSWNDRADEVQG